MKKPIIDFIKNIIRTLFISLGVLLIILLVSLFGPREIYYFERGIYYGYDLILEYKFAKAFDRVIQTRDFRPIALQDFSDKKIVRACVQGQYNTQTVFEKRIGHKVDNFRETSPFDADVLWLFFSDGSTSRARMKLWFWQYRNRLACTEKTLVISFEVNEKQDGYINFFFKGN